MDSGRNSKNADAYSRTEYRRVIAWKARIEREGPFLIRQLDEAPERSVLDLGCGTGEHTAFFARQGARAVGLDRSETMIAAAQDHLVSDGAGDLQAAPGNEMHFVLGEAIAAREALIDPSSFGLIISLGNMLPHLLEENELEALLTEVHELLLPGGRFLLQLLNYERLLRQNLRHLPLNFRSDDSEEEIVFLRLLQPVSKERILFFPTTLILDPDADEPVSVKATQRVELRPWSAADLVPAFERHGFATQLYGDMLGGDYDPERSQDLVLLATRN